MIGRLKAVEGSQEQLCKRSLPGIQELSAGVFKELRWIPTVNVCEILVEPYSTVLQCVPRPPDGPILSFSKDVGVQTEISANTEGLLRSNVRLLYPWAVPPTIGTEDKHEIFLYSPRDYMVSSNKGLGIKLDVSIELPQGVHGQIICHPDSPLAGKARIENAVIKPCSKDNIEVFVYNYCGEDCEVEREDMLGSVLLLQNYIPRLEITYYENRKCSVT